MFAVIASGLRNNRSRSDIPTHACVCVSEDGWLGGCEECGITGFQRVYVCVECAKGKGVWIRDKGITTFEILTLDSFVVEISFRFRVICICVHTRVVGPVTEFSRRCLDRDATLAFALDRA